MAASTRRRNSSTVEVSGKKYPVRSTAKRKLKQIDFVFESREIRGLEQNPDTRSRWAKAARDGKRVMQFLENHKYIAVVVDGTIHRFAGLLIRLFVQPPSFHASVFFAF